MASSIFMFQDYPKEEVMKNHEERKQFVANALHSNNSSCVGSSSCSQRRGSTMHAGFAEIADIEREKFPSSPFSRATASASFSFSKEFFSLKMGSAYSSCFFL